MRKSELPELLARVYSASDTVVLESIYDEWSPQYESDLVDGLGWSAPEAAAEHLARYLVERSGPILDIGAGTGLVGRALRDHGYQHIEALDISKGMLQICARKGVYSALHHLQLGLPLPLPDHFYSAVVAIGVLTEGHARPDCFSEITRILKPGGYFLFALRPDVREQFGFREAQDQFTSSGQWQLVECDENVSGFRDLDDASYPIWIYRILR